MFLLSHCYGQIRVENSQSAEFYIKNVLIGPGIEVGQIKHVGMIGGLGQFDADPKIIGVKSGLILSTGNADSILGPNKSSRFTSTTILPESKLLVKDLRRGDKDLNRLSGGRTTDITVIEFDFVPVKNVLEFNYVFGSEEYPEFVGSYFNDVFGFFLSGPGIKRTMNLAVLPDGKTPISVNNVNHKKNKDYYRRNSRANGLKQVFLSGDKKAELEELKKYIQFDGLTKVLTVRYDVLPYRKYHIKIAIGDVGDRIYDSGVFLEAGSFTSTIDTAGKYFKDLEVFNNTSPPNIDSILRGKLPSDTIVTTQINEEFEITDIYFDHDSYLLIDSSTKQLEKLAQYLLSEKKLKCFLYGHTNNVGSKNYNQDLSEKRAMAVKNYLISQGIASSRIHYAGLNFEKPAFDNVTDEGRARNRRVEIVLEE